MSDKTLMLIQNLHVRYGSSHVVQDVSLSLSSEPRAIIGRNGMGKTSLCNSIMGLVAESSGSIVFNNVDISLFSPEKRARAGLGYVPQGRRIFPSLTVDEHFKLFFRGNSASKWRKDTVYELFPRLKERRNNFGGQLSGGEKQMLAIGRALLLQPKMMIMDEPTEGLSPVIVDQLITTLKTLSNEKVGLLLIEQNLSAALSVANIVSVMVNGAIVDSLPSEKLAADSALQRQYLGIAA